MKKKILVLMISLLFIPQVKAECSNDRLNEIKELAKNIEITYELDTELEKDKNYSKDEKGKKLPEGNMRVIISGLTLGLKLVDNTYNRTFYYSDTENNLIILNKEVSGRINFAVYSTECSKKVRTISVKVPRYNEYSTDPLCTGIDSKILKVCDTWYEEEIDYETFKQEVESYKQRLADEQRKKEEKNILKTITTFFKDYYIYFIVGIVILVLAVILISIRRKRSVLQ